MSFIWKGGYRVIEQKSYIAIDLKSFYASVECIERGLDPMRTNLVVADPSRTEKTICLAVSPSLKAYGISGRPRLFEVARRMRQINDQRRKQLRGEDFQGSSFLDTELNAHDDLAADYIVAPPQMSHYMKVSADIYHIYLKYVAPEDIHVYSIDEVFIDAASYLKTYGLSARELAKRMILDVLNTTGIPAAAGIGTNLYLCKVAMDIEAKHIPADEDGVRIAQLDELSYRRSLWSHRPLTDFWRIGRGYAKKLEDHGLYTMGDIARCSVGAPSDYYNEDLLYKLFGVNAQLLIDHAWGWEPCTIADIKAYKPANRSIGGGQVLPCPYSYEKARLVVREMADQLMLDLIDKGLVTKQLVLTVGYDIDNLRDPALRHSFQGEIKQDRYGRAIPKHAHGTANLSSYTSSSRQAAEAAASLFDQIVDKTLLIRRISLTAAHIVSEADLARLPSYQQLDLFTDYTSLQQQEAAKQASLDREKKAQKAVLEIKKKYGKNAVLKGMSLSDGATARQRNAQIGGHKA